MTTEERALVLDYMPKGKPSAATSEPLAQVLGKDFFTLLEVTPKAGTTLAIGEEVYVGKEERQKIELIKGRILFKDLTSNALSDLEDTVAKIVDASPAKYAGFYNTSKPISLVRHQLELLPGVGKKHMLEALNEREKKPFEGFEDVAKRVKGLSEPKKAIIKRIIEELEGPEDKHYLFVRPPAEPKPDFYRNSRAPYRRDFSKPRNF